MPAVTWTHCPYRASPSTLPGHLGSSHAGLGGAELSLSLGLSPARLSTHVHCPSARVPHSPASDLFPSITLSPSPLHYSPSPCSVIPHSAFHTLRHGLLSVFSDWIVSFAGI